MPPRIPGSSRSCQPQQLLSCLEAVSPSSFRPASTLAIPLHRPSPSTQSTINNTTTRSYATKPPRRMTRLRRQFVDWLENRGSRFRKNEEHRPNYIGASMNRGADRNLVFNHNPYFLSQPVLSEPAREMIWKAVMVEGAPLKAVSADNGVDVRRVAAVVRMKEIEKRMEREEKPLAYAYARAISTMVPQDHLKPRQDEDGRYKKIDFEPINDIHIHTATMRQLFVPTSESRQFTRADAARAFGDHILPPDEKMRIPELVQKERNIANGMDERDAQDLFLKETAESEQAYAEAQRKRAEAEEARKTRVNTDRFEFRFETFDSEAVGPTGRARHATGWRYGAPLLDRKRGQIKIPTSVE
ncbi:eukaryotic mitochondrial regulator protein-domain-containing protein [Dichotomopilus funicola]|uniref:Eukaryotic mitochondrial regulator protein-domain-containing protein n=1 Tax=Dichotomopilus funicola TaxID=1934379 RepID=A0AAN6V314_9PEZI|nr:eukaryotic mitochondrial regulator protein-domain-containing protein [Dichotomopilus funicola]